MDCTQPSLPLALGKPPTGTRDYRRHGTTDVFAALNIVTGQVLTDHRTRHTGAAVLTFFQQIDAQVPAELEVLVVLDNLLAQTAPEVRA